MSFLLHWIQVHSAVSACVCLWLFNVVASTMPAPKENSSVGYVWAYQAIHLIASNLDKIAAHRGWKIPLWGKTDA